MSALFDLKRLQELLEYAIKGYFVSAFIFSPIFTFMLLRMAKRRRGTFILVTLGMMLAFTLSYFGLPVLMLEIWQVGVTVQAAYGISMGVGLATILIMALLLRVAVFDGPTPLEVEFAALNETEMSPMDINRKANMERRSHRRDYQRKHRARYR